MFTKLKSAIGQSGGSSGAGRGTSSRQLPTPGGAGGRPSAPYPGGGGGGDPHAHQTETEDRDRLADSLDKEYYTEEYDPVRGVLASLPPNGAELELFLRTTQLQQQKLLDAVSARLQREVNANYHAFVDGMRKINEIDLEVSKAGVHVSNSVRKLGEAKATLVHGTLGITYRRRRRERLAKVRDSLAWVAALARVERSVAAACAAHQYADAVSLIADAQSRLREASASSLAVVSSLRPRVAGALETLRSRVGKGLDFCMLRFDPELYGSLLKAYKQLDECGVKATSGLAASATGAAGAAAAAAGGGSSTGSGGTTSSRIEAMLRSRAGTAIGDSFFDEAAAVTGLVEDEEDAAAAPAPAPAAAGSSGAASTRGQGLLAEVGGAISTSSAVAASGILSVPGVSGPDSHLAALAIHVQWSALKALKQLTKDIIVDHLLGEERKAWEEEKRWGGFVAGVDLTHPTAEGKEGEGEAAAATDAASAAARYAKRRAELREQRFADLCASIAPDEIPTACMRVAAALVHVMHSHALLLQWHRTPFDPRANDSEDAHFLHRCALDEPDAPETPDDAAFAALAAKAAARAAGASGSGAGAPADAPAFLATLKALRPFLLGGRAVIWQHMQQRFAALLFTAVGAAGVALPVERLAQCLVLARDLMAVGLEYLGYGPALAAPAGSSAAATAAAAAGAAAGVAPGDDPCGVLRGALRLLCSQHLDAVHIDSYEKLRQLLTKELWHAVPVSEQAMASVFDAACAGSGGKGDDSGSILSAASSLRNRFSKAAIASIAAATAAIRGVDLMGPLSGAGGGGASDGASACRAYSDNADVFSRWLERGNPFGWVALDDGGKAGASVLPTPRRASPHDDDDDDEGDDDGEEEDDDGDEGGAGEDDEEGGAYGRSPARSARPRRGTAAAASSKRRADRWARLVHGPGYMLDVALGRGPGLGFSLLVGGAGGDRTRVDSDDEVSEDEGEGAAAAAAAAAAPSRRGTAARPLSDDEADLDDDDPARIASRRARKQLLGNGGSDGSGGTVSLPASSTSNGSGGASAAPGTFGFITGGATQHVVTAAALNGFARAVGKYLSLMEVLPTIAADAFTGLARLFELYLYTVGTLFIRGAHRQLFAVPAPAQLTGAPEDPAASLPEGAAPPFPYLDPSSLTVAGRLAAAAADARSQERAAGGRGWGDRPSGALQRRLLLSGASSSVAAVAAGVLPVLAGIDASFDGGAGAAAAEDEEADAVFLPAALAARVKKAGRDLDPLELDSVTLHGVRVFLRGLPALAQAQELPPDFYLCGPGANAGATMRGNSFNAEGVFVMLRRALQLIGSEFSTGVRMGTGSASVLAEGTFAYDTPASQPGYVPPPFVSLNPAVDLDAASSAFGATERCVAAESLDFVMDVMHRVRAQLSRRLPPTHAASLGHFYSRAVLCCLQLRGLVYQSLVPRLLPEAGTIPRAMLADVKWEAVRDAMLETPRFVEYIGAALSRTGAALLDRSREEGGLPPASRAGVWACIVSHLLERFVDGVSRVRRTSDHGRGLMSVSLSNIFSACNKPSLLFSPCLARDKAYVDEYIGAHFRDSESEVIEWVRQRRARYAFHHVRAVLLNGQYGVSKKKRETREVLAGVEAWYALPAPPGTNTGSGSGNAGVALLKEATSGAAAAASFAAKIMVGAAGGGGSGSHH